MALAIGMDVGGTKSRAILVNTEGEALGMGVGGSGNINFVTQEQAEESFTCAIIAAQKQAGIKDLKAEVIIVGIEPPPESLYPVLKKLAKPQKILHKKEGECSLVGGLVEKTGISLIAGTGSVGWGRNKEGRTHVTSCWGTIGDEGSAYDIARRGVNAAFWATDGRGEPTNLVDNLLKYFKVKTIYDIVSPIYQNPDIRKNFASLSRLVMKTFEEGDPVATQIIQDCAGEIAHIIATCAKVLNMDKEPYKVAATGGLVERGGKYFDLVEAGLKKVHPQAKMVLPKFAPVVGAALIALDELGIDWDGNIVKALERTLQKRGQATF